MHTHDDEHKKKVERGPGYETSDANVRESAIFLIVLIAALGVIFVVAFGLGKLINMELAREDGPTTKWNQVRGAKSGNLVSDPKILQEQLQQVVKKFPEPRLQTDDGETDIAEMHAREDMLLNNYTWVDQQKQTVRIPITRAMQLIAQRGLPVQNDQGQAEKPMFGDGSQTVTAPLTNGFARTGPELQMMEAREQQVERGNAPNAHAQLQEAH